MIFNFKKSFIEKQLNISLIEGQCLGLDIATETGYSQINIIDDDVIIECSKINLKKCKTFDEKCLTFYKNCDIIIAYNQKIVIEDIYSYLNVKTLVYLARLGMIPYIIGLIKNNEVLLLSASHVRKLLGFKGNDKKEKIQKEFLNKLNIKEKIDDNIIDAIMLSIVGVIK